MLTSTILLFLAATATSAQDTTTQGQVTTAQETCTTDILNPISQFGQILSLGPQPESAMMISLIKLLSPNFETCLASTTIVDLLPLIQNQFSQCINVVTPITEIEKMLGNFDAGSPGNFSDLCPLSKQVLTCLKTVLPTLMSTLKEKSSGCCDALLTDTDMSPGTTLNDLILSLATKVNDVFCSVQTPGFDGHASQTCAFTFYQAFNKTAVTTPSQLYGLLSLTNDNACDAYNGKTISSQNRDIAIGDLENGIVMGSCAVPVDNFMSELAQFPYFKSDPLWSKLFAKDERVTVMEIITTLKASFEDTKVNFPNSVGEKWDEFFRSWETFNLELNVPTAFTGDCVFEASIELASLASKDDTPSLCHKVKRSL